MIPLESKLKTKEAEERQTNKNNKTNKLAQKAIPQSTKTRH